MSELRVRALLYIPLLKVSEAKTTLSHRTEDLRTLALTRDVIRSTEISSLATLGGQSGFEKPTYPPTWYTESSRPQGKLGILGVDVPICGRLCENRCGESEAVLPEECYCDEVCELYGDCCLDYYLFCYSKTYETSSDTSEMETMTTAPMNMGGGENNDLERVPESGMEEEEPNPKMTLPVPSEEGYNRDADSDSAEMTPKISGRPQHQASWSKPCCWHSEVIPEAVVVTYHYFRNVKRYTSKPGVTCSGCKQMPQRT